MEIHKGPTQQPQCPWRLHARRARALPAAPRRSGRTAGRGGARRLLRVGQLRPSACSRTLCPESSKPAPGGCGGARAVGTCSPRASRAPPPGRPAARPRPPQADFLPLAKLHLPPSSPLSGRKRKQNLGCERAALRWAPPPAPRPSGALL